MLFPKAALLLASPPAVKAAVAAVPGGDEKVIDAGFGAGDAALVAAAQDVPLGPLRQQRRALAQLDGGQAQQGHHQGHTGVHAVLRLLEIGGPGVAVHLQRDLVHPGQRVQHRHVGPGRGQLVRSEDIAALEPLIDGSVAVSYTHLKS